MSQCRSCGTSVLWCRTTNGRNMPVDALAHEDGNVFVTWGQDDLAGVRLATVLTGDVLVARRLESPELMHRPHFATCPDADKHRRKK